MNFIINPLFEITEYKEIINSLESKKTPVGVCGTLDSQKVHFCYAVCTHLKSRGLFIAPNEMTARKLYEDFSFFAGEDVVFFPTREIMMRDIEAKSYDEAFLRIEALARINDGNYKYIVTSVEAITHKLVTKELFIKNTVEVKIGESINLSELGGQLVSMGYERVSTVEGRGQFAIRGGIIDVFSTGSEHAVRIELFGDEVDSIRKVDTLSQRSVENLESTKVLPAKEVLYEDGQRKGIIEDIKSELDGQLAKIGKGNREYKELIKSRIDGDIEKLISNYYFPGMDRLIPYIIRKPCSILDYIPSDTIVFADESVRMKQRAENILLEHQEQCKGLMEKGYILPSSFNMLFDYNSIEDSILEKRAVYLSTLPQNLGRQQKSFNMAVKSMGSYKGHIELLLSDLREWKDKLCRVVILSGTRGRGERLVESLKEDGIEAVYSEDHDTELIPGQIMVTHGSLAKGFEYPLNGLIVLSDRETFGQDKKHKKVSKSKNREKIKAFTDLNVGDYVVHEGHGIGQYVGIQQLSVEGIKRDYLKISYLAGDFLYIPTNQLDLLQKYIGSEGKNPKLSKLGGSDWSKAKNKVKESLKELAEELIKLYAQRQAQKGHAFSKDTIWQKQFEETFPYDETEDQLKCIEEIKEDMESERVMDRLLCGDVGYGKTEVAIRAVMKAALDGKQVAYLVPTTILAQQQYSNFKERMNDFPVNVEVISRFRSPAEQKRILKDVKNGVVDVLVGTHRLLQKDIAFKSLGLLVVDEEQRFGVAHKEKIKKLKPDVDVLTLTATPIPRTLHMSMVGIRDISVLEDPPEERYLVQTYVMEYNPEVIRDGIIRELGRNGQVFYLYNRVRSIHIKASEIQALVPDARVAAAHGQMDEKELEDIMQRFIEGEFDVLVCTTIIESGLDMPNVNTIIIEDADRMGLAQLYQLRGRVGRSNRVAYAYVTYKKDKVLSEISEKRLSAIREFTEFGSGFKIAMRDLEIRGAGNLLGPQQHGQMETVGYEMYCKLLDEAVRELKGEEGIPVESEISIDINVSAYIDDSYISSETQKIEMYKRIASIQDKQDVEDVEDELIDRFGDMPAPVKNLIQIANIKAFARDCGFTSVQEKNGAIILQYQNNRNIDFKVLGGLMDKYKRQLMFTASSTPYLSFKVSNITRTDLLDNVTILLQDIKSLQ